MTCCSSSCCWEEQVRLFSVAILAGSLNVSLEDSVSVYESLLFTRRPMVCKRFGIFQSSAYIRVLHRSFSHLLIEKSTRAEHQRSHTTCHLASLNAWKPSQSQNIWRFRASRRLVYIEKRLLFPERREITRKYFLISDNRWQIALYSMQMMPSRKDISYYVQNFCPSWKNSCHFLQSISATTSPGALQAASMNAMFRFGRWRTLLNLLLSSSTYHTKSRQMSTSKEAILKTLLCMAVQRKLPVSALTLYLHRAGCEDIMALQKYITPRTLKIVPYNMRLLVLLVSVSQKCKNKNMPEQHTLEKCFQEFGNKKLSYFESEAVRKCLHYEQIPWHISLQVQTNRLREALFRRSLKSGKQEVIMKILQASTKCGLAAKCFASYRYVNKSAKKIISLP